MIYGIDLGTTNSLIGSGGRLLTGLVASNVDLDSRKAVKRDAIGDKIVESYKTDMSMSPDGEIPIYCSSVVLRELAETASRRTGEECKEVVISVPAYFSSSQREAVYKAGDLAGLEVKALINEPTAAALYVCKDIQDMIVVYDLGGGTFDVSIVDSRAGNYTVIATDGIVLGGDDLDNAMVQYVIKELHLPIRLRTKSSLKILKTKMRLVKEQIQATKCDVQVDMNIINYDATYLFTAEEYESIVKEIFYKTVVMTNNIIAKNLPSYEHPKLVFVGGSTSCPYVRDMVLANTDLDVTTADINPDLIVAAGITLYAKLLEEGKVKYAVEDVTKRLCIETGEGKSLTVIESNTVIPCSSKVMVSNSTSGSTLALKLYQGANIIAKENDYIGELIFSYGRNMEKGAGVVEVRVDVDVNGVISLKANEVLFGDEFEQEIKLTNR